MQYTEMHGPLEGWTYDEHGTIYTSSGYRCSARTIECALWLFQCYGSEARRWMIRSDEAPGALRPLHQTSDAKESGSPGEKTQPEQSTQRRRTTTHVRCCDPEHEVLA